MKQLSEKLGHVYDVFLHTDMFLYISYHMTMDEWSEWRIVISYE